MTDPTPAAGVPSEAERLLLANVLGCEFHDGNYGECAACSSEAERVWDEAVERIIAARTEAADREVALVTAAVEAECAHAESSVTASLLRTFDGQPFPASVPVDRIRAVLSSAGSDALDRERAKAAGEVVAAVEAELDDADQVTDTLMRPNHITVWGVRRVLMRFGGKPHRWPVPAEFCAECGHNEYDHDNEGGGECTQPDCDCLLSRREVQWGRDEEMDESIQQAIWEDAVTNGEEWANGRAAAASPEGGA